MEDEARPQEPSYGLLFTPMDKTPEAPTEGFGPLTDDEKKSFEYLRATMTGWIEGSRVALMRVRHRGTDRAVLAVVSEDVDGSMMVAPLAMLMDDALFAEMDPAT